MLKRRPRPRWRGDRLSFGDHVGTAVLVTFFIAACVAVFIVASHLPHSEVIVRVPAPSTTASTIAPAQAAARGAAEQKGCAGAKGYATIDAHGHLVTAWADCPPKVFP